MPIQEVGDAPMSVNGVGDFLDVMTELMVNQGESQGYRNLSFILYKHELFQIIVNLYAKI